MLFRPANFGPTQRVNFDAWRRDDWTVCQAMPTGIGKNTTQTVNNVLLKIQSETNKKYLVWILKKEKKETKKKIQILFIAVLMVLKRYGHFLSHKELGWNDLLQAQFGKSGLNVMML